MLKYTRKIIENCIDFKEKYLHIRKNICKYVQCDPCKSVDCGSGQKCPNFGGQ